MNLKKCFCIASAAAALTGFISMGASFRAEEGIKIETSPDGMMWTVTEELPEQTQPDGMPAFWYNSDEYYKTGITSSIRALTAGEHYYKYDRTGIVPVGEWKVNWSSAFCLTGWTNAGRVGHGITYGHEFHCEQPYFSGWTACCADCGEPVLPGNVYMSMEAVRSLRTLNVDKGYYFLCPCRRPIYKQVEYEEVEGMDIKRPVKYEVVGYEDCGHLEQYFEGTPHVCRAISHNRYQVIYNANTEETIGIMEPSFHMYNNEKIFEGKPVTPQKNLSICTYDRTAEGYVFAGWNTRRDGSGTWYADGAEIYNLSLGNYKENSNVSGEGPDAGTVILYAQWRRVESTLGIDAAGGEYQGASPVTKTWDTYLSLDPDLLIPPAGHTVSFRTDGGAEIDSITGTLSFLKWEILAPANGILFGNTYIFRGENHASDTVRAVYKPDSVILPLPEKEGSSFGGWYCDSACTRLAGYSGEPRIFTEDVVLYAKWVDLKLTASPDYESDGGRGAVGLSWSQQDGLNKSYRIFRRAEGQEEFEQILLSSDEEGVSSMKYEYPYEGQERTLSVPSNGFYTLAAEGAQGGSWGENAGGAGGSVSGSFYLEKGEVVRFAAGGQDGWNGGGAASDYAPGGGYTLVSSDKKGVLLAAGGGGGATASKAGLPGGAASERLVESGRSGQDGMAGGGGGWLGGAAGIRIKHLHSKEAGCYADTSFEALLSDRTEKTEGIWTDHEEDEDGQDLKDEVHFFQQMGSPENLIPTDGSTVLDIGAWVHVKALNCLDPSSFVQVRDQNDSVIASFTYGELLREWEDNYKFYETEGGMNAYFSGQPSIAYVNIFDDWSRSEQGGGKYDTLEGYEVRWTNFYENGAVQMAGVALDPNYGSPMYLGEYPEKNYPDEYFFHAPLTQRGFGDRPLLFVYRSAWYGYSGAHFIHKVSLPEGTEGIYLRVEGVLDTVVLQQGGYEDENGEWVPVEEWKATGCEHPTAFFDRIYLSGGSVLTCREKDIDVPAGGGSSYINPDYALSFAETEGAGIGDGSALIQAELTGLVQAEGMDHAAAPDLAPPHAVRESTVSMDAAGDGAALIRFEAVEDRGTKYYFKAESYSSLTGSRVCDSNVAECLIMTGLKGYYYLIDADSEKESSEIAASGIFLSPESRSITVPMQNAVRYVHIAASDNAGNLSEPLHLKLDESTVRIPWEVSTENMDVSAAVGGTDYGNVFPASDSRTYYVRADGVSPFLLSFHSFIHGAARTDYQIDQQIFDFRTDSQSQRHGTKLPYTIPLSSMAVLDPSSFGKWSTGSTILTDASFIGAERSGSAGSVNHFRAFVMPPSMNGVAVTAVPVAGASFGNSVKYSDWNDDMTHFVRLIGDGEGPVTNGLEILPEGRLIDREDGPIVLELSADDALSGVKEFYVTVKNTDSGAEQRYEPDADGIIRIDVTAQEPVFSGCFTVEAHAFDNVGNESVTVRSAVECSLTAEIYRMLPPHEPAFKRGESGVLEIRTWGCVDRVEVEYPRFFSQYNRTFEYFAAQYRTEEDMQFMIPLELPLSEDGSYEIKVRAYKGDYELESIPSFMVHGTVLDDIRTRLR